MQQDSDLPFQAVPMADLALAPGPAPAPAPRRDAPALATSPSGRTIAALNGRHKAAILVQLLLSEGAEIDLSRLPEPLQDALTEQILELRLVDRDTVAAVVSEFVETLEQVGLSFTGGVGAALKALDGRLSPAAAIRLRQLARRRGAADPWDRLAAADSETLLDLLAGESTEVAAVVLSKLAVGRAADLLARMPGPRARQVAYAVSLTEGIAPRFVARIGNALAAQIDDRPAPAFVAPPATRMGAILTSATARLRDDVLGALDAEDADFAEGVRKAIFTFADIHTRLRPRDVPKVLRDLGQGDLITALAYAGAQDGSDDARSAEFLLANMSQRLAGTLRDEVEIRGKVRPREGEAATGLVVDAIRSLLDSGEIEPMTEDEEETNDPAP